MEKWRPVVGYEGFYEVSTFGRVRSILRRDPMGKLVKEKVLIQKKLSAHKYMRVTLSKNGFQKGYQVHRLVAQAFLPNPLNKGYVNHKDGRNPTNNNVSNLEWATQKENMRHAATTGLLPYLWGWPDKNGNIPMPPDRRGSKAHNAILNEKLVKSLRKQYRNGGVSISELARRMGMSMSSMRNALLGRTWAHV